MKKLLLFSVILLGSVGLVSAQTAKKAHRSKVAKTVKTVKKTDAQNASIVAEKKANNAAKTNTGISKGVLTTEAKKN